MKFLLKKINLLIILLIIIMVEGCTTNPNIVKEDSFLSAKNNCVKGPIEGTCIETDMAPTCYRLPLNQHQQICGPMPGGEYKDCDFGYGCYAMEKSRVCCSYCPIEWSGNCIGLQPDKSD